MASLVRILDRATAVAAWIGGLMLIATAILVFVEVLLRKLFLMSLGGADELSGYAYAIAASWGFAFALLHRAHIRIDVLYIWLPAPLRAWLDLVALLALGLFAAVLLRHAADVFLFAFTEGTHSNTPLQTPMWIPQGLWVGGFAFFFLVLAAQIARCVAALVRRDWTRVREVAGTRSIEDEIGDEMDPKLGRKRGR